MQLRWYRVMMSFCARHQRGHERTHHLFARTLLATSALSNDERIQLSPPSRTSMVDGGRMAGLVPCIYHPSPCPRERMERFHGPLVDLEGERRPCLSVLWLGHNGTRISLRWARTNPVLGAERVAVRWTCVPFATGRPCFSTTGPSRVSFSG